MDVLIEQPDVSWSKMISEIKELNGVTHKTKAVILDGWEELAKLMGKDWPNLAQEQKHPWIQEWYNKAPWVKAYFGHIGHQLSLLKSKVHFDSLLERLRISDATKCYAAQAEINAAWKLEKSRIPSEFVEPSQRTKSFDIRAIIDRKKVGVEVSTFGQSQKFRIQMKIFQEISMSLMAGSLQKAEAAGQIHRMLSRTRAKHIIKMIEQGIKESLRDNKVVLIEEEDAFEFCIVPKKRVADLQEWKQERDMGESNQLSAPNFDISAGNRLHAKILRKCKQIPPETPGVVYLEGVPIYIMDKDPQIMMNFNVADIEEAVYENTNLLFAVLNRFSLGWKRNRRIEYKGIRLARILRYGLLEDASMIIINRYHKFPSLRHKKLINAFLS